MRWSGIAVLAGCGRIAFEPLAPPIDAPHVFEDSPVLVADAPTDATPLVCSQIGLPCAGVVDFVMCGSTCFATCAVPVPFNDAVLACNDWSGRLAIVRNGMEQTCLSGIINDAWIGLTQSVLATQVDQGWQWNDGQVYPLSWNGGEPEDGDGIENGIEQCAILSAGGFADIDCGDNKVFACSRPAL